MALYVTVASYVEYLTVVFIDDVGAVESMSMPPVWTTSVESSCVSFTTTLDLE